MRALVRSLGSPFVLAGALTLTACAGLTAGGPTVDLSVAAIVDVNPTSASYQSEVHPDDYQGRVSAWYFGHAT